MLTYDVDVWIHDTQPNRGACERALAALRAQWGPDVSQWTDVAQMPAGWLDRQGVYCLTSPSGAIDIFRQVRGLSDWLECRGRAALASTRSGILFVSLSDADMLQCQLALPEHERHPQRIARLQQALREARS